MNRVIIFSYALFLIFFCLFSYFFVDLNLIYLHRIYTGFAFSNRELVTFLYILFVVVFFIFYLIFLRRKLNLKLFLILTCGILLFSYSAFLSYDIFNYITTVKVLFNYHENPYIVMPVEFKGDPNLLFTHAANKLALYGPFWLVLSGIPYLLSFGNFLLTFFELKILIIFFYLGTIYLIKKITKNNLAVVIFALNPLVIIETLMGNHNDIVMMFFALFSFFLLTKKKILYALIFLIISILIKYATIFLLPVFILVVIKILRKAEVKWNKIFMYSSILMFIVFLFSAFREEIYPWYAIWFLTFVALIPQKKILLYISLAFSFGLLFRYVPFMLTGSYFGITPIIKTLVTFVPVILALSYGYFKRVF